MTDGRAQKSHMDMGFLSRPRAIETLLVLLKSGEDEGLENLLKKIGGSHSTAMQRIHELVKMGLVKKFVTPKIKRRVFYRLSSEGVKVAILIEQAVEMLKHYEVR